MNLRQLRKSKKISGDKLAEMTGIHVNTLYSYEKGKLNPSEEYLQKIADALGVSVSDIIGTPKDQHSDSPSDSGNEDAGYWKARALHLEQVLADMLLERRSKLPAKRRRVTVPAEHLAAGWGNIGGYTRTAGEA